MACSRWATPPVTERRWVDFFTFLAAFLLPLFVAFDGLPLCESCTDCGISYAVYHHHLLQADVTAYLQARFRRTLRCALHASCAPLALHSFSRFLTTIFMLSSNLELSDHLFFFSTLPASTTRRRWPHIGGSEIRSGLVVVLTLSSPCLHTNRSSFQHTPLVPVDVDGSYVWLWTYIY